MDANQIIKAVKLYGDLMELHNENPFKVRSFQNAYSSAKKLNEELLSKSKEDLTLVPGIGKSVAAFIMDLRENKPVTAFEKLVDSTPEGIRDLLQVKGMGPKRVLTLWKTLNITDIDQLINECESGNLARAKGFGEKTQQEILEKALLFKESKGKLLYSEAEKYLDIITQLLPHALLTGEALRKNQIISEAHWIIDSAYWPPVLDDLKITEHSDESIAGVFRDELSGRFSKSTQNASKTAFVESFTPIVREHLSISENNITGTNEDDYFHSLGISPIIPELRWDINARNYNMDRLVKNADIKGLVHCHTNYSDGVNSLQEMIDQARNLKYEYIVITDHSKSAGYAGGLSEERVLQQKREIDEIRASVSDIVIYQGIESDILTDGSLDYDNDFLHNFDVIIASVHSVLNMDVNKATTRLIKAIEHPATNILGHSTGRLLLQRKGYPLNWEKIFDACKANNVAIELNANPRRLDLDFTLIRQVMDKGIMIPINPDAHSTQGMNDVKYGVIAGRAGGLTTDYVLNALPAREFISKLKK